MQKPTSRTIAEIIEFVTQQNEVSEALNKRDRHPDAACTAISCRFYKRHPEDPTQSGFEVLFRYHTRDDDLERNDDVLVRVRAVDGDPPSFSILGVSFG